MIRIWFLGVAFLSLRLALMGVRVSALRRSGSAADSQLVVAATRLARRMGVTRAIRVLVSAIPDAPGIPDGPSLAGWIRPVILLPAATILNLTPEQLEAILAHEIAHLHRYDDVVNIAQSVIETILFYHPAVWWVSNRIRHERELCCDDLAVRTCGDALCYARALTALEKLRIGSPQLALGALGMADAPLEYRIRRIVGVGTGDSMASSLPGVLALGLALACAAIYSSPARGRTPVTHGHIEYPEFARAQGIQGTVPVKVTVDAEGRVGRAEATGGPKELRRAAVESASTVHFSPDARAGTQQVNVDFQLTAPVASAPEATRPSAEPTQQTPAVRAGPKWVDQGEYEIGIAATSEKDPAKKLALLKEWKRQYPDSELGRQRTAMMAQALLAVLGAAYGKPAASADALNAGKQAGLELLNDFADYFDDAMKPDSLTPERWAEARKMSQLQIHSVFAYIAQMEKDDVTAEAELREVLEIDPEQASASLQLGDTIIREIALTGDVSRYPEALYELSRTLSVTGPNALVADARETAEKTLRKNYRSYHGSDSGVDDLISRASGAALPPAGFHISGFMASAGSPELELWKRIGTALTEHGDGYFAKLREQSLPPRPGGDYSGPSMFQATVVLQPSPRELLIRVADAPGGDAVLRFARPVEGTVKPGTVFQFRGIVDSYSKEPYVLTLRVPQPEKNIVGLRLPFEKRGNLLSRMFKGLFRLGRHLV